MRLKRPSLAPRSVSDTQAILAAERPVREQTLRTLEMLKNMGYREVWCRLMEVNADTIDHAAQEGWRITDAQGDRLKFSLAAGVVPMRSPGVPVSPSARPPSAPPLRTSTITRIPEEPAPSPYAQWRKASAPDRPKPNPEAIEARQRARKDSVTWERQGSVAELLLLRQRKASGLSPGESRRPSALSQPGSVPSVVVSPPLDVAPQDDYFSFAPSVPQGDAASTPPFDAFFQEIREEEQKLRRGSTASLDSTYSSDGLAEDMFTFDIEDPFTPTLPTIFESGSPSAPQRIELAPDEVITFENAPVPVMHYGKPAQSYAQLRRRHTPFRPVTPELRVAALRKGSDVGSSSALARSTFKLGRMMSDPGAQANLAPRFDLQTVLAPRLPNSIGGGEHDG